MLSESSQKSRARNSSRNRIMPGQPLIGRAIFGQFLKKCRDFAAFFLFWKFNIYYIKKEKKKYEKY